MRGRFEDDTEASVGLGEHGRQPCSSLSHQCHWDFLNIGVGAQRVSMPSRVGSQETTRPLV